MKLYRLAIVVIIVAFTGIAALAGLGWVTYVEARKSQVVLTELVDLKSDIDAFSVAADSLLLYETDGALLGAVIADGEGIVRRLDAVAAVAPEAHKAAQRVEPMLLLLTEFGRGLPEASDAGGANDPAGPLAIPMRARSLISQMANLGIALDIAMDRAHSYQRQVIDKALARLIAILAIAGGGLGLLVVAGFAMSFRVIAVPLRQMTRVIARIESGEPEARMRGGGFSELHDLANAFNRLVEREHTAKAQLVASQQDLADRARLLAESQRIAHICSWQRDLRTQEVKWTEEAREILGIDTTYVDGEGTVFIDLVHPDDRAAFMAAREASYCGDGPTAIKHRIIRPDGELRFCVTRSVAKVEENGRAVVMAGTLQDVTDQEIAERADAEQRRILEMAGRIARFGGWTVDVGTWRVTWSREMCALHGLPEGATPTLQQVLAFIVAEDREKMTRAMMACINQGTPYDEECRVENAQGNVLWVRTVGEAVRDENGNIVKLAGALQDLTTQKNVEEMLRHTQRLEAVGKLTGGVAHDFNNMLTVIIGAAQIMVDRVSNDPMLSKLADMTLTAANRGAKLTSRLLAVAQRQTLAPKPTDLVGLLLGMENLLRRAIGEDIELEINSPANLSRAMIDPNELENAILNLCINARDAMPDGGVLRIDVEECWLGESMTRKNGSVLPGTYVMVSISDTGHGMDQATVSRCFEPFFTTKEEGRGSGLGLSMVFGFVKQSNGHIELDSEVGVGTTIKLYLPVVTGDVELEEEPEDLGTAESGNEFVLVVEDDDLVAASLESKLERLNYRVEVARNGPEAMRILRQHPDIDLLLTDIVMPGGMNGRRLAKEAGQLRPGLSVVLMSGYSDQLTATEGAEGPKILLRKPFTREQLAAALRRALETADTV